MVSRRSEAPKRRTGRAPVRRPSGRPAPKVRPERAGRQWVELISIGRELLRGRIADHNSQRLARRLTQHGATVRRITLVDDQEGAITSALREALARNPHLVVTTGGLGPALDDRTLLAVADVLEQPLVDHAGARELVEQAYRRLAERKVVATSGFTAAREKMCRLPVGGVPLANPAGIAPGVLCRLPGGAAVLCLPGAPDEMEAVFDEALTVLNVAGQRRVAEREVEAPTEDESALRPLLERLSGEYPDVWIHSHRRRRGSRRIFVRLEASGDTDEAANRSADAAVRRLIALAAGSP